MPPKTPAGKAPVGIRTLPNGKRQAHVRVRGRWRSKVFEASTALLVMQRWREEQRVRARLGALLPPAGQTLAEDVRAYLPQVATMPTFRHRADDLARWIAVFGPDRVRKSITSGEIRAQLEAWRAAGYAPSTCNHRKTALQHLWTTLDGKSAPSPAKDVPRYREALGPPRALSPEAVALLLELMPASQTRARLSLMAWTGFPPAQIATIEPADIKWGEAIYLRARQKGAGVPGAWLPLLPPAWAALRDVARLGAWGKYSTSSARTSLRLAASKAQQIMLPLAVHAELADVTPYQFRHSFGTLVAAITQDDRAVQTLMRHADIRMTHRYTGATVDPRTAAALARVQITLGAHTKEAV